MKIWGFKLWIRPDNTDYWCYIQKNNITIVIFGYLLATYGSILDSLSFFHNCIEQVKVWLCSKSEANLFDGRCKSLIPNDMVKLIQCRI